MSSRREDLERAVLAAAEQWYQDGHGVRPPSARSNVALIRAIGELIFECPECNTDRHTCPGCGASVAHYGPRACSDCEVPESSASVNAPLSDECLCSRTERVYCHSSKCHGGADVAEWTARTMADARRGDRIRPAGSTDPAHEMDVADRYWPPSADPYGQSDTATWHVVPGPDGHWNDHVVQLGECCVVLGGDPRPRFFPPTMAVDILLTPAELSAIEAIGWENRISLLTSK